MHRSPIVTHLVLSIRHSLIAFGLGTITIEKHIAIHSMIKMQWHLFLMIVLNGLNQLLRISPPRQMFFLSVFQNYLAANFALGRVTIALHCMSCCLGHFYLFLAVSAGHSALFFKTSIIVTATLFFLAQQRRLCGLSHLTTWLGTAELSEASRAVHLFRLMVVAWCGSWRLLWTHSSCLWVFLYLAEHKCSLRSLNSVKTGTGHITQLQMAWLFIFLHLFYLIFKLL